ncbi:MAG: hypothetical protein IKF17_01245 [Clostridia bacterium]|nr:hypothetical protein [Clostridia bacterium]
MKSQKGVTLTSLIIYVIAMSIVVGTVAAITNFYYGNINGLSNRTSSSKQYTQFNSYFVNEVNTKGNNVVANASNGTKVVFTSGNQITYLSNAIYYNKIKICNNVTSCQFTIDNNSNTVSVNMVIGGKGFQNVYSLQNNV